MDQRAQLSQSFAVSSGWHTAGGGGGGGGGDSPSSDAGGFAEVGKGGKKKNKKKGQRLDVAFGVSSSGGANRGAIDTPGAWGAR